MFTSTEPESSRHTGTVGRRLRAERGPAFRASRSVGSVLISQDLPAALKLLSLRAGWPRRERLRVQKTCRSRILQPRHPRILRRPGPVASAGRPRTCSGRARMPRLSRANASPPIPARNVANPNITSITRILTARHRLRPSAKWVVQISTEATIGTTPRSQML